MAKSEIGPGLPLLIALSTASPFAMNMIIPAMPQMARSLEVSYGRIQLVVTLYLASIAVAQLILGPLSDRFGRRPVMLAGFGLFVLGSVICAVAATAELMIFGRVVQAGGCVGLVLGRAIIRDLYDRDRSASLIGYVTMAMVVAPMLAPVAGGLLIEQLDWRYLFWTLAVFGVSLLWVIWRHMRETHKASSALRGIGFLRASMALFRLRAFCGYAAIMCFSSGMFFSFLIGAPYLVIELLGRTPLEYALYFALCSIGYMLGNFLSGRFSVRLGPERMILAGCLLSLVGLGLLWLLSGELTPLGLFIPMAVIALSNGLTLPSATASAISLLPELAGTASGISGALQLGLGALLGQIVGLLQTDSALPLMTVMTLSGGLALLGLLLTHRK